MAFRQHLTCIGEDERYPNAGQWWQSKEGFYMLNFLGGPHALAKLDNFVPRKDDIYVVSFPKTGTTWLQEIAYLIATDLDFEKARQTNVFLRCPYLDWSQRPSEIEDVSPRFLKLHLPYSMIPQALWNSNCKVLYTMRNPKDTLVSYYYFCQGTKLLNFKLGFEEYFDAFLEGKVSYGPYWKHCREFVEQRHHPNILIVTYEEMKKDLASVIRQVANFLEKSLTEAQVSAIEKHCQFDEMKKNPGTNPNLEPALAPYMNEKVSPFMRKGQIGDWKNYFTDDMNRRMDEHIAKYFQGIDFVYE